MATLNGHRILTPLVILELLGQHNLFRDGLKSVSIVRAETADVEDNPLNFNNLVARAI